MKASELKKSRKRSRLLRTRCRTNSRPLKTKYLRIHDLSKMRSR